jgi:hypothetical protein
MQAVASTETKKIPLQHPEGVGGRTDYIGSPGIIDEKPQAFLVDRMFPGAEIAPHFHDVDQYQVVVGGYCNMGKKAAPPVSFQYADAYTPYGPIRGKEEGFSFFTLRPIASGGFFPMPGSRQDMPGRAGRNISAHFDRSGPAPAAGQCEEVALMDEQGDGVDARGFRLGAGGAMTGPASDGGGQYYLVCEGEVTHNGKTLPQWSLAHVQPGEAGWSERRRRAGAAILPPQRPPRLQPSRIGKARPSRLPLPPWSASWRDGGTARFVANWSALKRISKRRPRQRKAALTIGYL